MYLRPPEEEPDLDDEDDDESSKPEDSPEVKVYKKKLIPLIVVCAVQFIAICILAANVVIRPNVPEQAVEETPSEQIQDVIQTETIVGKWKYDHSVVDYSEYINALQKSLDAKKGELSEQEYQEELLTFEQTKQELVNETKEESNLKDSCYVFDDTGAFKTEGVKAQVTVLEQVSTIEADYEGAYVLDETNKILTLKANGTYLTADVKYNYYVSTGTLSLTTNENGVVTHAVYTRVY